MVEVVDAVTKYMHTLQLQRRYKNNNNPVLSCYIVYGNQQ